MSTLALPTLQDLLDPRRGRRPYVPQMVDDLDPFAASAPAGLNLPSFGPSGGDGSPLDSLPTFQPPGLPAEERRGAHPKLRALVDAGPDAVEGEIRDFLKQAPPEAIDENPRALWQTALEYLDLPRNAVFNLVNNLFGSPIQPSSKETFAGLRKIYGADLLRTMGWHPDSTIGKVGQFIAGLGIDFVADPITWLTGFFGLAKGTTTSAARTAEELAAESARALQAGKGLEIGGRFVRPSALEGLTETVRAGTPIEEAAAALSPEDLYRGNWGLGVSTVPAKTTPIGHVVAGPAILAGKAGGALVEGAGRVAESIPVVGKVVGRPLEWVGKGVQVPFDLLGEASDLAGTPLSWLPAATAFKPFREIPGLSKALDAIEAGIKVSPTAQKLLGQAGRAGEAITQAAGKIGIGRGGKLQQLVKRFVEDAELQRRRTEAEFREEFGPQVEETAKALGIAKEHLEPLYPLMQEYGQQIRNAAASGSEAQLRSVLDAQEAAIRDHLSRNYPKAKVDQVVRSTDAVMAEVLARATKNQAGGQQTIRESVIDPSAFADKSSQTAESVSRLASGASEPAWARVSEREQKTNFLSPSQEKSLKNLQLPDEPIMRPLEEQNLVVGQPVRGSWTVKIGGSKWKAGTPTPMSGTITPIGRGMAEVISDTGYRSRHRISAIDFESETRSALREKNLSDISAYNAKRDEVATLTGMQRGSALRISDDGLKALAAARLRYPIRWEPSDRSEATYVRFDSVDGVPQQIRYARHGAVYAASAIGAQIDEWDQLLPTIEELSRKPIAAAVPGVESELAKAAEFPAHVADAMRVRAAERNRQRFFVGEERRKEPRGIDSIIDLDLPGTSAGRHSMAYKAGLSGNAREAKVYADETVTADHVAEVTKLVGADGGPLVFVPMPSTSGSGNAIPKALADKLAGKLGGTVAEGLLSSGTQQSRRSKNLLSSLANPRNFVAAESYDLPAGARLVLVDDVARSGGTIRDAAQALGEAGYRVEAAVAGKVRRTTSLTPTRTQVLEIRQRAKGDLGGLEEALQRPVESLTAEEATTLLRELRKPGASGRAIALQIERLREVPLPAEGRPGRIAAAATSRAAIEDRLAAEFSDLQSAGHLRDVAGENAAAVARVGDVEQPLDAGYTFSRTMKGEAEELQAELRGRGYAQLADRVKVLRKGQPSQGANLGDDAIASLRDAGQADPIQRMADSIIAHATERSRTQQVRQAADWIEANPEIATPAQKDLLRRYRALTAPAAEVRQAARGKVGELVSQEQLAVGDRLNIAGEPHTVTGVGPEGVRIKDGAEFTLQPGEPVFVDRGSHEPDPLLPAVQEAVAKIRGEGGSPNVKTVIGAIRETLPEGARDREWKRILGIEKLKGNKSAIESKVELAMLRAGEGARGANWESILRRLEEVEQGRAGRYLTKIESASHPLGAFIRSRTDPITGAATTAQELTDLGEAALRAMRANLAAGGEPGQVGRIIERLNGLEASRMQAKRAGSPVPRGINQEISLKRNILERMGRTVEDEIAVRAARSVAEAAGSGSIATSLPVPKPRDLFAEPVAAIVEKMESLRGRTESEEATKLATGRLTTESGMGYFPRIPGSGKSFIGKMNRLHETKWRREWERAAESLEAPELGVTARKDVYGNLLNIVRAENKARAKAGLPLIAEPGEADDLSRSVAEILDRYQDTLTAGHRFQLRRTFLREAMLHEVNNLAEFTGVGFQTDPVAVWLKRRIASHYAVAGADFLEVAIKDAVANGWGLQIKGKGPVPKGFARITDQRFGALAGGWAFKEELVKQFQKFTRTMDRPHLLLRAFDWATSQWRSGVLGVLPYTMTNLLSGVFQANQFDAFSQKTWSAAKRFMEDFHAGRHVDAPMRSWLKGLPAEIGDLTAKEFYNTLSVEHGTLGKGFYGVEMEGEVGNQMRTGWSVVDAVRSTAVGESKGAKALAALTGFRRDPRTGRLAWDLSEQAYFKGFRAANVAVEDWMKIGFILERLKRGDALAEAVQKSRLALNQSADLTDFEKATFRRLLPFWGWMKGNAILQFHRAVARPQITALVSKIRGDLEASFAGDETLPPSLRPRHVAEELGVQLTGGAKPDFVNLTRMFPVKELGTTPLAGITGGIGAVADTILGGLNPLLKQPLEATVNRDFYWDRPITEYEGQSRRFLGMNLSPQVKRVLSALRPLNVVEQLSWRGPPGSLDDVGFTAAQVAGVRTFPVDVKRQLFETERAINDQLGAVMRDFSRARTRAEDAGRDWRTDGEVNRLAGIYRALREKRDSLPLKALRGGSVQARREARERRGELRDFALAG